jgi:hypothetical protein
MKIVTLAALLALGPALCLAEKVAVTFDDLPVNGSLPAGVTEVDIVERVLPIFSGRKLPPMYGFVNARKLEGNPTGAEALRLWMAGGQRAGNHTYSHIDLTRSSVEEFTRDVAQNEPVLLLLSPGKDWRWFRYPYLHEGDTLDKRGAVRAMLKERRYAFGQKGCEVDRVVAFELSRDCRCLSRRESQHGQECLRPRNQPRIATAPRRLQPRNPSTAFRSAPGAWLPVRDTGGSTTRSGLPKRSELGRREHGHAAGTAHGCEEHGVSTHAAEAA